MASLHRGLVRADGTGTQGARLFSDLREKAARRERRRVQRVRQLLARDAATLQRSGHAVSRQPRGR